MFTRVKIDTRGVRTMFTRLILLESLNLMKFLKIWWCVLGRGRRPRERVRLREIESEMREIRLWGDGGVVDVKGEGGC